MYVTPKPLRLAGRRGGNRRGTQIDSDAVATECLFSGIDFFFFFSPFLINEVGGGNGKRPV